MAWAEGRCRGERVLVRAVQGWGRGGCRHGDAQLAHSHEAWGTRREASLCIADGGERGRGGAGEGKRWASMCSCVVLSVIAKC